MANRRSHTYFPTTHVNCRVGLVCDSVIGLEFRQCSLNPMHHYPYGYTLDNFAFNHIFQRCYVHRSLSGVAPLLEAANAGGYRSCQHSWLLRALLLSAYAARAPSHTHSGPAPACSAAALKKPFSPGRWSCRLAFGTCSAVPTARP